MTETPPLTIGTEASPIISISEVYGAEPFNLEGFKQSLRDSGIVDVSALANLSKLPDLILGVGGNAVVCRIPNVDGYVVRIPNGHFSQLESQTDLRVVEDRFPELNLGQPVAAIGNATVLKEQKGIPAGVPYGEVRRNPDLGNIVYIRTLQIAASMPQVAFDNLARLFQFLNEQGINFDPSKANNLLIDTDSGRFNVVDLGPASNGIARNRLGHMVIPLMDNAYNRNVKDPESRALLQDLFSQILTKCIAACEKVDLPPSTDDSSLKYSFTLAGREAEWEEFNSRQAESAGKT